MANESPEPPSLDESLVQRLVELAIKIDGCHESVADKMVREFNELAGTEIPYAEFQGIYGGEEHENYVRRVLTAKLTAPDSTIGREQLVEMFKRVSDNPSDDSYLEFAFSKIKKTFGDAQVSDLVFWPGHYFGDGDDSRELTPEQMADAVLERYNQRNAQ
ncbi:MAG: hypothetical protein AAFN77_24615 [Planctomycetota bacterium]